MPAIRKETIIGLLIASAIVVALVLSTLQLGEHTCRVCMDFKGMNNCATASGTSREEALRSAVNTACGPISGGVTESIACGRTQPASVEWQD